MASPAKRRKKNDHKASPSTVRSLDHFFKKKKTDSANDAVDGPAASKSPSSGDTAFAPNLTDEEVARRLQKQWDQEDRLRSGQLAIVAGGDSNEVPGAEAHSVQARPHPDAYDGPLPDETTHVHDFTESLPRNGQPGTGCEHDEASVGAGGPEPPAKEPGDQDASVNTQKTASLALQSTTSEEDTITWAMPFDESPLGFQPSKFIPGLQKHWVLHSGGASYALLTRCFMLVNSTQSRIKIVDTLVNFLRLIIEADPDSLLPAVWLATNSISPPFVSMELGIGGSAMSKALKQVCGLDSHGLKTFYTRSGDLGDVAFEAKKRQSYTLRKPRPLSIRGVYQSLVKVAGSKGHGSQEVKQKIVERLLQDARGPEESRYVMRTLAQHLRIGAVKTTMLIALSRAFLLSRPPGSDFPIRDGSELAALKKDALAEVYARGEEIVKACYARRPDYNHLVPSLLEVGVCEELCVRCSLAVHIPLRPMLGSITRDLSEMLTKLQGRDFSCEYKYDGQRAQIHCDDRGKVSIFSRHLELMTDKYPDLVALVPKMRGEGVASFIVEGEVVAIDRESGELKTFQTLAGRGRKDVAIGSLTVDVCLFAFDLMYLNGEELLGRSFRDRRELLRSMFIEIPRHFTWVKSIDATSTDSEAVLEFFKSATDTKCEGVMVKVLDNSPDRNGADLAERKAPSVATTTEDDQELALGVVPTQPTDKKGSKGREKSTRRKLLLATYEPDKRVDSWLKVKKDYDSSNFDTLDLIPVAGWHGQGRKARWWSPILLAARNSDTGTLEAVCKCISGFSDKFYGENKAKYAAGGDKTHATRPGYVEYSGGHPDVWFEPQEVWEMAFADITISPTYTAAIGLVDEDKGLSLRFPRFLKVRPDKSIDEASTTDFLAALWRRQEGRSTVAATAAGVAKDDDRDLAGGPEENEDDEEDD